MIEKSTFSTYANELQLNFQMLVEHSHYGEESVAVIYLALAFSIRIKSTLLILHLVNGQNGGADIFNYLFAPCYCCPN